MSSYPDGEPGLAPLYLRSLLRVNLSISLVYFGLFSVVMLAAPVLFWLIPDLAEVRVGPVPLGWAIPLFVVCPSIVVLAARYRRSIEAAEAEYEELIDEP